jgi:hypothetical protein
MNTKVTSKNQSGGVTGQNVSFGPGGNVQSAGSGSSSSVEAISCRKAVGLCVGAVGLIASIFGILEYLGIKLWG